MLETVLLIYMSICTAIVTLLILAFGFVYLAFGDEMREDHKDWLEHVKRSGGY